MMTEKRKVILDTDIGPDCDDCGALAILCDAHRKGIIDLLGVTHCTSDLHSVNVIAAINDWFGVDVPIGQTERRGFLEDAIKYTKPVSDEYMGSLKASGKPLPTAEKPIPMLRRLLAENSNVTFVLIGPLGNFAELLDSTPDDISPLDGVSLVKKSVEKVVIMGGDFAEPENPEYNIRCDIPAAKKTAAKCPVDIIWCGFEAGLNVITGETLRECPAEYPVRRAYELYTDGSFRRPSWDLVTVFYSVAPNEDWEISEEFQIDFGDDGRVLSSAGKGSRWIRYRDEKSLQKTLNEIIAYHR